jgi:hypothetical protein
MTDLSPQRRCLRQDVRCGPYADPQRRSLNSGFFERELRECDLLRTITNLLEITPVRNERPTRRTSASSFAALVPLHNSQARDFLVIRVRSGDDATAGESPNLAHAATTR